jgi:hypothetical protein
MHRAGDWLTVLDGPGKGCTLPVASVRMYATDNGYYLIGGGGLYRPHQVTLARERTDSNPCNQPCDDQKHKLTDTCDHCRGVCRHEQEQK